MEAAQERSGTRATWLRLLVSLVVGLAYPFLSLWIASAHPESEAFVWGKAYLPLAVALSVPIVGGITFAILTIGSAVWRRVRRRDGNDPS